MFKSIPTIQIRNVTRPHPESFNNTRLFFVTMKINNLLLLAVYSALSIACNVDERNACQKRCQGYLNSPFSGAGAAYVGCINACDKSNGC